MVEGDTALAQGLGIIDGDTFRLAGEVIRISNIDAPEMPPRSRCWAEARLARAATMELQRIRGEGTPGGFRITREGQDRYSRTLARVSYDGGRTDAGETMIARGMASPWTGRRWDWCAAVSDDPNGAAILRSPPSPIASMLEANR
ncbi:thermonuclease family protein [Brevundimonas sp. TWP3-1-2b1]|uniref:thermonuclease family protein n=1 Tax=Brevundimonas sp. TWP3-1-2b1 TaxID=2804650 RepID=UPI003CF221CC